MSDKKLAVTIAGAVSLGAYEAGVAFELLRMLAYHNQVCDQRNEPNGKIHIDVLTGASAGATIATILAQKMLFMPSRLLSPEDNDLYLPWVKDVDLVGLLDTSASDANYSILSSTFVDTISKRYITDLYSAGLNVAPESPHAVADVAIHLGLAMSNLNGITYKLPVISGGAMPYTRFQDSFGTKTPISSANPNHNTATFWEPLRNAAVSAGAFPFAFRPKEVLRDPSDYPVPQNDPPPDFPATGMRFAYTDGGVFQNEPIGLAKGLVDLIDEHVNENRFYLFIAPGMRNSASSTISASTATLLDTAKALVNAIFNQARYRDLEHIEEINNRIASFDIQAIALCDLVSTGQIVTTDLAPTTQALLPKLFPDANIRAQETQRLRTQFAKEYSRVQQAFPGGSAADQWIDAVLLLETTAKLGPRDTMTVYAITDDSNRLAGSGIFAFAGFFDVAYRQHDYNIGRQSARDFVEWLNKYAKALPPDTPCLGPIYVPNPNLNVADPININSAYDNLDIQMIPRAQRVKVRDQVHSAAHNLMADFGIPWAGREAIDIGYLNGFLDKLFGL